MSREPNKKERFEVLLEQVRGELAIVAEGHVDLDRKVDRIEHTLSKKIEIGFADVQIAIQTLAKQVQEHTHA